MAPKSRRGDVATQEARRASARIAIELRDARLAAGLSLSTAARAVGMSAAQLGRVERGEIGHPTMEQVWRAAAAVGLRPALNLYQAGSPVRDRAQLALLARFEARLGGSLRLRREVPLPIAGDPRAWDGMIEGGEGPFFIEGESHIRDAQALERRMRLKVRDDPRATLVILVASRSVHNRAVLGEFREVLRDLLPLDGGPILRAIAAGRRPRASGIVLV